MKTVFNLITVEDTFCFWSNETQNFILKNIHCVKSVRNRSYSGPHFPAIGLNTNTLNTDTFHVAITALIVQWTIIKFVSFGRNSNEFLCLSLKVGICLRFVYTKIFTVEWSWKDTQLGGCKVSMVIVSSVLYWKDSSFR